MKTDILDTLKEEGPLTVEELAAYIGIVGSKGYALLIKEISRLESRGVLVIDKNGRITPKEGNIDSNAPRLRGRFTAHKNGFGFVALDEEGQEDLFIKKDDVGYAIDGDSVDVVITKVADPSRGLGAEAKVVAIIERSLTSAVGAVQLDLHEQQFAGFIQSRNQKIRQRIYLKKGPLVLDGTEVVKVSIEEYPTETQDYFVARIVDVIGHSDDVGIDVLEVLESMDIVSEFPEDVMQEANQVPDAPSESDMVGRRDLRDIVTITIDGAEAKDLDDAIHIKSLDNGNVELGVHIADVSYYVREGSALDAEAIKRGTSVYVTDRVVPMLPERLSNGICSLNPQVDRLTQSAIMEITPDGRVVNHWIGQTVIKTTYRMTYHKVNEMLAGDAAALAEYDHIADLVPLMAKLHEALETMRYRRGALNFETKETKIIVDDKGKPVDIVLRQRGVAERMIESFMLVANETVAEHFATLELPFIYRIHEEPKAEKLQAFIDYASTFGVAIHGTASQMTQEALQDVMKKVAGEPYEEVLSLMLLRSMQQAKYDERNIGHYGLGATYYTHFTSPIRRYPDLLVHRMIREYAHVTEEKMAHFQEIVPALAVSSSQLERRAIDAERDVEAMKKAEYMADYVGEEFDGVVASVVKFGLFVALPNTIEGLVHITTFPEFMTYNERTMTIQGERSGTIFRVGQPIRIKLIRSDKTTGQIDFEYLVSDLDVVEKVKHPRQDNRQNRPSKQSSYQSKGKKPFYKDAPKGGRHGKR